MRKREIMRKVYEDPETDSKDILATLLALNLGGSITKHEVAQQGKMGLTCAHVHMHRLSELGYFTRVRRTAADGADRPTIYRLNQDDGPTDGQEMAA